EWVHVQLHQQKGMISLSPPTICNSAHLRYREGAISYLDVIDSDRTILQQEQLAAQLKGSQIIASINLIRALGGGWSS
ncbi:hypothetical protein ABTI40_14990, partial [Acinetobacter baumannii]